METDGVFIGLFR